MSTFEETKKEDEKGILKLVAVQLPEEVVIALKEEAHLRFISLSDVIRECLFDMLRSKGKMPERG